MRGVRRGRSERPRRRESQQWQVVRTTMTPAEVWVVGLPGYACRDLVIQGIVDWLMRYEGIPVEERELLLSDEVAELVSDILLPRLLQDLFMAHELCVRPQTDDQTIIYRYGRMVQKIWDDQTIPAEVLDEFVSDVPEMMDELTDLFTDAFGYNLEDIELTGYECLRIDIKGPVIVVRSLGDIRILQYHGYDIRELIQDEQTD